MMMILPRSKRPFWIYEIPDQCCEIPGWIFLLFGQTWEIRKGRDKNNAEILERADEGKS